MATPRRLSTAIGNRGKKAGSVPAPTSVSSPRKLNQHPATYSEPGAQKFNSITRTGVNKKAVSTFETAPFQLSFQID